MHTHARTTILSCTAALAAAASAGAGVISTTNESVWQSLCNSASLSYATETFNGFADGFYGSPLSATTGPVAWTATSSGGLRVQGGVFATRNATPLTFSFDPALVRGVGGNLFATNGSMQPVSSVVTITLGDGTGYAGVVSSSADFTGFWSNGAGIASITISATDLSGAASYPSVDRLVFATVPAPGAIAALALAGAGARGRRRRATTDFDPSLLDTRRGRITPPALFGERRIADRS